MFARIVVANACYKGLFRRRFSLYGKGFCYVWLENGKCENLHGHRWRVVAYLEQAELQTEGTHKDMVIDFAEFKHALRDLTEELDHSFVVEEGSLMPETLECLHKEGFTLSMMPFRTTAENLARYFFDKLADKGFPVSQVDVYETPNNCAIYRA